MNLNTYVLVDLREVLKTIIKVSENETTFFVRDLIDKGHNYIVLDGNNRFVFLRDLFSGDWVIPADRFNISPTLITEASIPLKFHGVDVNLKILKLMCKIN